MNKSLKIVLLLFIMLQSFAVVAQKFGYIDSEFILNKHPNYKIIQDELNTLSNQWKNEAQNLDKEVKELYNRIFGINGEYFQKQAELLQPLQSKIYDAIERVSRKNNLAILFDKASVPTSIIYTNPRHDYSEFVLAELGIENN